MQTYVQSCRAVAAALLLMKLGVVYGVMLAVLTTWVVGDELPFVIVPIDPSIHFNP